jgi:hypothetical protein
MLCQFCYGQASEKNVFDVLCLPTYFDLCLMSHAKSQAAGLDYYATILQLHA